MRGGAFKYLLRIPSRVCQGDCPDICGLEVNSVRVRAESFEGQLFAPSRRVRGDGLYWLDQIMRSAGLLGAENYTFCGAGYSEKLDCTEDFDCLSGYIRGVIEFCARYGVNLRLVNSCGACIAVRIFSAS